MISGNGAPKKLLRELNLWVFNKDLNKYVEIDDKNSSKYDSQRIMYKGKQTCKLFANQLRWNVDINLARRICCNNRLGAEQKNSWENNKDFNIWLQSDEPKIFYDSVSNLPVFKIKRPINEWIEESQKHGWPSFRDNEIIGKVRVLPNGEVVTPYGYHLGDNLPDKLGNRYCINLVSIAGQHQSNELLNTLIFMYMFYNMF